MNVTLTQREQLIGYLELLGFIKKSYDLLL